MEEKLVQIATDIELNKSDLRNVHAVLNKIDQAIEKMTEVSSGVSRMLVIHENKIENNTDDIENLRIIVEERKRTTEHQIELISVKMDAQHKENHDEREKFQNKVIGMLNDQKEHNDTLEERIRALEVWKWWLIGGGTVIGFMLGAIPWSKIISYMIGI